MFLNLNIIHPDTLNKGLLCDDFESAGGVPPVSYDFKGCFGKIGVMQGNPVKSDSWIYEIIQTYGFD